MPAKAIYLISAKSSVGGRDGHVVSDDKSVDPDLVVPKDMGGPGGVRTNPKNSSPMGVLRVTTLM